LTIARAIQQYLQAHRTVGHRPKTLEWHQTVLAHLHQYLQTDGHLVLVHQLTETALRNWLERLSQTPTAKGAPRSASTIETYARSARAFCGWLIEQGVLSCSPLSERLFPRTDVPLPHVVSPARFEQIMRAGFSPQAQTPGTKRLLARDRALLWVLFDTGITVTELCALSRVDVQTMRII
jgi:site-specific recombinase XerD